LALAIAVPGTAAAQEIGDFLANIRSLSIAQSRYSAAIQVGDNASAKALLACAQIFFIATQQSLFKVSNDLALLARALDFLPASGVILDVPVLYSSVRADLLEFGFPPEEQRFIDQYQVTEQEENAYIDLIARIEVSEVVNDFGETITFQGLIELLSQNSLEIANNLAELVNFIGQPPEPPEPPMPPDPLEPPPVP
jgi:hypothetical protein